MRKDTVLVAALALASLPLMAQQPPMDTPPNSPATQPTSPTDRPNLPPDAQAEPSTTPAAQPEQPASPMAAPTAKADMRPVSGELVSKLDTKTAKTGDDVVVQTKTAFTTSDGTKIPKGSKVMGKVVAVQASAGGQDSQVALKFDHAELEGGQSLQIESRIQSVGSADSAGRPDAMSTESSSATSPGSRGTASGAPGAAVESMPGSAASGSQTAGTVVAKNGNITIRTTSVPDVLLANNDAGQEDPRMAHGSSILLGAKKDVQLEGGTPVVLAVSIAGGGAASSSTH